jgi:hypothetical protein
LKVERLFSENRHLLFSLLFTGLALLLLAFKLPSFPEDPGLLLIISALCVMVILYTGLDLKRKQWLIAPIIGIAATFVSALYSKTVYPMIPCGATLVSQGYPYPWIRRFSLPSNSRCIVDFEPIGGGLSQLGLVPSPIIANIWFITDAVFYTLIPLAILELVAGTRRFLSTTRQQATLSDHSRIAPDVNIEKTNHGTRVETCQQ